MLRTSFKGAARPGQVQEKLANGIPPKKTNTPCSSFTIYSPRRCIVGLCNVPLNDHVGFPTRLLELDLDCGFVFTRLYEFSNVFGPSK